MSKKVLTIDKDEIIFKALKKMAVRNVSSLMVFSKKKPWGIITERDIVRFLVEHEFSKEVKVGKIANHPLKYISPHEDIVVANDTMKKLKIRRFPVMLDGKLKGIITQTDLSRAMGDITKDYSFKLVSSMMDVHHSGKK